QGAVARRTRQGRAAARTGAPAAAPPARRTDDGARPGGAPRNPGRADGRRARRGPRDTVFLAQHAGRGTDLGPDHVPRPRADHRIERQGHIRRSVAASVPRRAAGRCAANDARRRSGDDERPRCHRRHAHVQAWRRSSLGAGGRDSTRGAAHDARGDLRLHRHAQQGACGVSGSIVGHLILKDLFLLRWLSLGTIAGGVAAAGLMALSPMPFSGGGILVICARIVLNIFLVMLGVVQERKDKAALFVLSLPVSPAQYAVAKVAASTIAFMVPWAIVSASVVLVIVL